MTTEYVYDQLVAAAFQSALADADYSLMAQVAFHQNGVLE